MATIAHRPKHEVPPHARPRSAPILPARGARGSPGGGYRSSARHSSAWAQLTDEEYAARVNANDEQVAKDKNPVSESEFSAEDPAAINASRHWLERPETPSHATSMVVDPPNGRLPALTPAGEQRQTERRAARTRGLPASYKEFTNYDRCITRGATGSILPVI